MFSGFLILILPVIVVYGHQGGQYATPTDPCQAENYVILGCIRNHTLFRIIDDVLLDDPRARPLSEEISYVLNCTQSLQCHVSQIFKSYIMNHKWILDYYHEHLEKCASRRDIYGIRCDNWDYSQSCLRREFLKRTT